MNGEKERRRKRRGAEIVKIDTFIMDRFGIYRLADLWEPSRDKWVVMARYAYFYLLSKEFEMTPGRIGEIGKKDRTTVIYGLGKVENLGIGPELERQFSGFSESFGASNLGIKVGQLTQK